MGETSGDQAPAARTVTPLSHRRLRLPPMRASIRDIFVAIAFGTIIYRVQTQISPLERLYRLKGLDDRQAAAAN